MRRPFIFLVVVDLSTSGVFVFVELVCVDDDQEDDARSSSWMCLRGCKECGCTDWTGVGREEEEEDTCASGR